MALYTDSDFITPTDLSAVDGEVAKNIVDNTTLGVTLSGPGSVIRRTIEESGSILMARFQSYSGYLIGGGTSAHFYAVANTGGNNAINRPRIRLAQVVAIEPDPSKVHLRRWIEYRCLAATFRAVFRRFTGKDYDRYVVKVNDYDSEAARAATILWANGLPVLPTGALDCPGALRQYGAGTFDSGVTVGGSGSTDQGATWDVAITYTGVPYVSANNKGNAESAGSVVQQIVTGANQIISVSIAALTPPTGVMSTGTGDGIYYPATATGWNVYVGTPGGRMYLQNATPLPITTLSYTLANAPTTTGALLTAGQYSTSSYSFENVAMRA